MEEPVRVRATEVTIDGPITVRDLAERMGLSGTELIKSLIRLGIVANLNQVLDPESARVAVTEMGVKVHEVERAEGQRAARPEDRIEDEEGAVPRPPVVTVMGHVDHGKTSLLDAIRQTNVTAGEAGGITQHIGASTVDWQGKRIVFLDTPGHEAFTAMRARGARVTDIAVLVVAADDGVMPQTIEAINHARAAKVPIIVALNKIDKPNALPDRVKKQLQEHGLTPEEWGGETIVVPVSAKERTGINDLLDIIILVAEMGELKANPDRRARGIIIETRLDKGLGPVASVLVQSGTLRIGDPFVAGTAFGRVRAMVDDKGNRVEEAGPSTPVEVVGFDELPEAGDLFQGLADDKMAREIASQRDLKKREQELGTRATATLADFLSHIREGEKRQLNLVLKADVQGSLEALKQSFEKLEEPEVGIDIIHTGVGGVTESDVNLAKASEAMIIAFNVTPDASARQAAEREKVEIRTYRVIYEAIGDVKAAIKGLRAPTFREVVQGHAEVRELFRIPKVGTIAGCYVTDGKITRRSRIRVVRDGIIVQDTSIASLKHFKDDVREIAAGFECGIGLENFQDIKEGDVLEAFTVEEVRP
ncbi:MAG: translation initiation factor IF-2 [Bacillota bacterium]